jgi:hypothetical protein
MEWGVSILMPQFVPPYLSLLQATPLYPGLLQPCSINSISSSASPRTGAVPTYLPTYLPTYQLKTQQQKRCLRFVLDWTGLDWPGFEALILLPLPLPLMPSFHYLVLWNCAHYTITVLYLVM